jgi:hypothetical protein
MDKIKEFWNSKSTKTQLIIVGVGGFFLGLIIGSNG